MVAFYIFSQKYFGNNAGDVWIDRPTNLGVVIYSVFTPCICFCGIIMNFFCILVLCKKQMSSSFYIYLLGHPTPSGLVVIAAVDLVSCVVIFISGLARGIFWVHDDWVYLDVLICIPLCSFLSTLSTISTVCVTIDRLIFLWNPARLCKPKFCHRSTAWFVTTVGFLISFLAAIPYCFIFKISENGNLISTEFYKSRVYFLYNWFELTIFSIIPLIILSIGNVLMIRSIKKALQIRKENGLPTRQNGATFGDQTKMTITLIALVFLFMVGELPSHVTARESATNIIYLGNEEQANTSQALERTRQIVTITNAIYLTVKFFLYCLFCPPFYKEFKATALNSKGRKNRRLLTKGDIDRLSVIGRKEWKVCEAYREFLNTFADVGTWERFPRNNSHNAKY